MPQFAVALVSWRDSCIQEGQVYLREAPEVSVLRSVGFLLREDATSVTITRDLCQQDQEARGIETIPREAILSMQKIRVRAPAVAPKEPEA